MSQGEVLEVDKGSGWPLRNIDQQHHHPRPLGVGQAALRRLGGWVVLTDVIMDAISTLCTSTEPSCQGSARPGAVSLSHQRLLSSGHMARLCLEAPSDVSSTEPLQHRRRDGDPHIVLRERGLGGDH